MNSPLHNLKLPQQTLLKSPVKLTALKIYKHLYMYLNNFKPVWKIINLITYVYDTLLTHYTSTY